MNMMICCEHHGCLQQYQISSNPQNEVSAICTSEGRNCPRIRFPSEDHTVSNTMFKMTNITFGFLKRSDPICISSSMFLFMNCGIS